MKSVLGLFLLTALYLIQEVKTAPITNMCKPWSCEDDIGHGSGDRRTCAALMDSSHIGVQKCEPEGYFCYTSPNPSSNISCSDWTIPPWKNDLPAGDSCTNNDECYTQICSITESTKTCYGKPEGEECYDDRECNLGLYCSGIGKCQPVSHIGDHCEDSIRCEFGSLCVNETCQAFGSLKDGDRYYLLDSSFGQLSPGLPSQTFWVCENFYAFKTGMTSESGIDPIFECGPGPEKQFSGYERKLGDDSDCIFTLKFNNGTEQDITEPALCGYNHDTSHYCPKRRGYTDYEYFNVIDRQMWKDLKASCHHRSTIQYCSEIQNNAIDSIAFRSFLQRETETQGDTFPLIANSKRCSGVAILQTANYWRLVDSAYGTPMAYFALVIGFVGLAYLN